MEAKAKAKAKPRPTPPQRHLIPPPIQPHPLFPHLNLHLNKRHLQLQPKKDGKSVLTIRLNLPIPAHNDSAQMRPLGQILEIEANMICFGQRIKVDLFEREEVERVHCAH